MTNSEARKRIVAQQEVEKVSHSPLCNHELERLGEFLDSHKQGAASISELVEDVERIVHNHVFAYSEWLDGEGLVLPADAHLGNDAYPVDERTHDDLANAYLRERSEA